MPNGQRESYEAVPRRPEQQGTEDPALSMALCSLFLCYHVSNKPYPCLKHTQSPSQSSVTPRTCSSVTMSQTYLVPVSTLCYSSNLFICYHVSNIPYSCLKHTLSLSQTSVTPRTCSSVTMSFSYPVPLSTLPCPYPVTKKVKPYSFTFFFFPLLSLLIRSRAVTTKTYFVCPP